MSNDDRPALTSDEVRRGLFPKTMDDLQFRSRAFAPIVRALAEHEKRKAKKAKAK